MLCRGHEGDASSQHYVDGMSKKGKSALMLAAFNGRLDVVKYLVDVVKARVNIPLESRKEIMLRSYGTDSDFKPENALGVQSSALINSCRNQSTLPVLEYLLSRGADVAYTNGKIEGCNNALMEASKLDNKAALDILLDHTMRSSGGTIDVEKVLHASNVDGNTCLMLACEKGAVQIVINFLDRIFSDERNSTEMRNLLTSEHFSLANKKGDTALTLLSAYFKNRPKKFKEFVVTAVYNKFYLFELVIFLFIHYIISPKLIILVFCRFLSFFLKWKTPVLRSITAR